MNPIADDFHSFAPDAIELAVTVAMVQCFGLAVQAGWHTDLKSGKPKVHNRGERLMLIVSEIAEAMEGHRKNRQDDHLPEYPMHAVELADTLIRVCDEAGSCGYANFGEIVAKKLAYNTQRPDHKIEARQGADGKAY